MKFTQDWFNGNIVNWQKHLQCFKNKSDLRFLEIGTFEGRSAIWLLDNILTDKSSKLDIIDPFVLNFGYDKSIQVAEVETNFNNNIKPYLDQVKIYKDYSFPILINFIEELSNYETLEYYDFIYIDGSHLAANVLEDAVLSFKMLKKNGILIFDDYQWRVSEAEYKRPTIAIDAFIKIYQEQIKVLFKERQLIIKKI